MSMDHPEGLGSASASEVPACPPGPGYNFRPRSRSATAPKNRRLGSVETFGAGSTLDLPAVTPPNSPTPRGAGIPTHDSPDINIPTIISHDSTLLFDPPFSLSTPIPDPIAAGVEADNYQPIPNTVGTSHDNYTPIPNTDGAEFLYSTLIPNTVGVSLRYSTYVCDA